MINEEIEHLEVSCGEVLLARLEELAVRSLEVIEEYFLRLTGEDVELL